MSASFAISRISPGYELHTDCSRKRAVSNLFSPIIRDTSTQAAGIYFGHPYTRQTHRKSYHGGKRMPLSARTIARALFSAATILGLAIAATARQQDGPQTDAPAPVAQPPAPPRAPGQKLTVPSGTRLAVVLENGISTRSAKAGDSLYFHTVFPITQNNHTVIPVGSYLRGSLMESKRPGRVKGRGEFRLRLESLIFPNGYTVDLLAAP